MAALKNIDGLYGLMTLVRVGGSLTQKLDSQLSIYGMTYSELMVLHHLASSPEKMLRRVDLADAVSLTASGVTRMLKPMEKLGWVMKQANARDARVSFVKLTDAGSDLYKDAFASVSDRSEMILGSITKHDKALILETLERV